jgi:hypothetical protein
VCYVFDSQTGQLESVLHVADREVSGVRVCIEWVGVLCVCLRGEDGMVVEVKNGVGTVCEGVRS